MKCHLCGTENEEQSKYCKNCGLKFEKEVDRQHTHTQDNGAYEGELVSSLEEDNEEVIKCPTCGSQNIHFVTIHSGSDFSAAGGCCGFILFGPLGLLCGLLSNKRVATIRKCMNCKNEF